MNNRQVEQRRGNPLWDHGGEPYAVNLRRAAQMNPNFRTALWTGEYLQVTLMTIPAGEDIGLERHEGLDQMLYIESGMGLLRMGCRKESLQRPIRVTAGNAVFVPAGTWHNISNMGRTPLKLFSVYAPPQHPFGTVEATKR